MVWIVFEYAIGLIECNFLKRGLSIVAIENILISSTLQNLDFKFCIKVVFNCQTI